MSKTINIHDTLPMLKEGKWLLIYEQSSGNHLLKYEKREDRVYSYKAQTIVFGGNDWRFNIGIAATSFALLDYPVEIRATFPSVRPALKAIRTHAQQFLDGHQNPAEIAS